jgi:hypothetical protein
MYVHVRQHPSVSWWVRRNEINTIPLVALAGVETEATISPWTAVAHRHPNLGDSVHSHTLPSLVHVAAAQAPKPARASTPAPPRRRTARRRALKLLSSPLRDFR